MKKLFSDKYFCLVFVALLIVVLDQWTKVLIVSGMPLHQSRVMIPGFFNLTHLRNYGAAWSLFHNMNSPWRTPLLLTASYLTMLVVLLYYSFLPRKERWLQWALILVIGGALGNILDRHRLGYVVDFLLFHWGDKYFPAFNVADSAISCGAGMIALSLWPWKKKEKKTCCDPEKDPAEDEETLITRAPALDDEQEAKG